MRYASNQLPIFVPKQSEHGNTSLLPGTAIVGIEVLNEEQGVIRGYFEGNKYGASNIESFEDKCLIAAGRGIQRYPTTAWDVFEIAELEKVGTYDYDNFRANITNKEAVVEWENYINHASEFEDSHPPSP